MSTIIVLSCGVLGHFTIQVYFRTFYIHNLEIEKSVAMAHLLPDIAERLTSSYSCSSLECKESTKNKSKKHKQTLPWQNLLRHVLPKM